MKDSHDLNAMWHVMRQRRGKTVGVMGQLTLSESKSRPTQSVKTLMAFRG